MTIGVRRLRVLVVDDSPVHRQALIGVLSEDRQLEVVGWSANGADALEAVRHLQPDIVTLDDRMPLMGGLEAAHHIMCDMPTPIVMVSSATGAALGALTTSALAAGVLAVHNKRATGDLARVIKNMAAVRLVRRRREPSGMHVLPVSQWPPVQLPTLPQIVAIGASTGGPQALREIITRLPASFPVPVLVVQHTTAGYSNNLVDWLSVGAQLPVRVAACGDPLDRGGVYVAPTQRHLVVQGRQITLLDTSPVSLHRPSATVLFQSITRSYGARSVGILLTGMGDDGVAGLIDMKLAGAITIAQDENTSVVFGMPAEAIRLGAVDHVLPPNRIPALLLSLLVAQDAAA